MAAKKKQQPQNKVEIQALNVNTFLEYESGGGESLKIQFSGNQNDGIYLFLPLRLMSVLLQ